MDVIGKIAAAVLLVPVEILRIIQAEFQPVLVAGLGQLGHDIAAKGRLVHHVVFVHPRMEQREAVVVLAGEHKILHAAALGQANPFVRVEIQRIESLGQRAILNRQRGQGESCDDQSKREGQCNFFLNPKYPLTLVCSKSGGGLSTAPEELHPGQERRRS